ncbi:hypothetical protein Sta7437_4765 (plasmid) [Stanieria cyanosphaera PCC 7437]|uniref:Uncharacterized protein n=1 Tax=Stanieria cyanosphaera (strain ATCC 29371 / PCC 7437) TaxID=111780 RepID=K9Y0D4_STAC7|nr:hypothetical protein [Stanieria cyanosphaera]AFZ38203.1 hypothetical protein Sta7437_4765 [Stanieria cyanosphaera PCC 7437]
MKTTLLMSLSALTLSLMATPTLAKEISQNNLGSTDSIVEITPFDLVYRAYQGDFTNSGIPGYAKFITAVNTGKVKAEDLVEKAISKRRLAPETIDDRGYINSVNRLMQTLDEN